MEEKKLTDEEILETLEGMASECTANFSASVLDLINRQKEEISLLKAENERLTAEINQRREMMSRMDCNYATELQKNAELQKQVKSLTEENKELHNDNTTLIAGSILQKEQVEKETAKEILQELYDQIDENTTKWVGVQIKIIAKRKGVEVE